MVSAAQTAAAAARPAADSMASRMPLEGVTYRPLRGRPALRVPLNLACRDGERSAATLGFIDLVRRLPS